MHKQAELISGKGRSTCLCSCTSAIDLEQILTATRASCLQALASAGSQLENPREVSTC